ncbi:MAG: response regulator [candidate division Zixibacteria bacterium]|nr:response regulator [candidate division Zixibacteria bacterium]
MRVLVVSANSILISQLTAVFDSGEDKVLSADSARKANQIFTADPDIHVVVLEVAGKSAGSLQFLREFKSDRRRSMIPVVAVGRELDTETVKAFVELHIDDIAALPLDKDHFRSRAQKLCEERRPTILVVDDEPAIRELLEEELKWERFRILTATSADEAIALVADTRVDLVVSDVAMPGKSGHDLLTFLKKNHPHLPVIIITGFSDREMLKKLMALGADGFFTKPFHNNELITTVHRVMAMRRTVDAKPTTS